MKVCVAFRGGVGDFFVWLVKLPPLLEFHRTDEVHLMICSPWPDGIQAWALRLRKRKFDEIHIMTYDRPLPAAEIGGCLVTYDLVYHADFWKGERGAPTDSVQMRTVEEMYPWLEPEWYPTLDIDGDGIGGTVFQAAGRSVGKICTPGWWRRGLMDFPTPHRIVGVEGEDIREYGATARVEAPHDIYAAIRDAEVFCGIDSGFRNIAFTLRVPVVEVRKAGVGFPAYDTFVPHIYRDNMVFLDLDPPTLGAVYGKLQGMLT